MSELIIYLLFGLIPVSSILLCFVKDSNPGRKTVMNILLIGNAALYLSPLLYTFISSWPDGNMWSENGSGAVLWFYFILVPVCFVIELVLLILKMVFRSQ